MFTSPRVLALLALAGCNPWRAPHDSSESDFGDLWDPTGGVPLADGLYARLPATGGLVRAKPDGSWDEVDFDGAAVTDLVRGADGETLVAFAERYSCADEDVRRVADCDPEDLDRSESLAVVRDGAVTSEVPLDAPYNALAFSQDGRWAVAFFDFDTLDVSDLGIVSLNAVLVIDFESGKATPVTVGFDADRVLFTTEASGAATRAVVLSQSSVGVIDLTGTTPARTTTFPLTLDPDMAVTPAGVALTPDGQFALISTVGSSDLYALDLVNESIRIVELGGQPSDFVPDAVHDVTLLTYATGPSAVDVLDNQAFELTRYDLEERATQIVLAPDSSWALLWGPGLKDVYRLDLPDGEVTEYRLLGGASSVSIAPGGGTAVVTTTSAIGGTPGMELLDLHGDDTAPFSLEGEAVGVAFSATDGATDLLLLQRGIDYLFRMDLGSGLGEEVELPAPPVEIGALPDGPFYITHPTATGLVSFLQPDGTLTSVSGFAATGLLTPASVTQDEE